MVQDGSGDVTQNRYGISRCRRRTSSTGRGGSSLHIAGPSHVGVGEQFQRGVAKALALVMLRPAAVVVAALVFAGPPPPPARTRARR